MAKIGEKNYFKKIGEEAVVHSLHKPYSNRVTIGSLLHDIAAVFTLFPNKPAELKILDLGCGTGWTSNFFAKTGHRVVGVDISPDAIREAKKHFTKEQKNLVFKTSDYDNLAYNNEFDVVVFFDSLHHSENEIDGLQAAFKSLKPGGKIIVCEPGSGHSKHQQSIEAVKKYGVNERDMPPKLSKKALRTVGFINIKTYAYPALIHRALYENSGIGITKILRANNLTRSIASFFISLVVLRHHGIVTAIKPIK